MAAQYKYLTMRRIWLLHFMKNPPPPHDTKAQKPIKKLKSETEFETVEEEEEEN